MSVFRLKALVTTICALVVADSAAAERMPLRLATQVLPPYQMIEDGQMTGIAIERVKCALESLNTPYEFHMTSWSLAQLGTETGRFDGFFVGSANSHRAEFAIASDPVISEELSWYQLLNSKINPNEEADALRARYSAKFNTSKWRFLHNSGYNVVMRPRDAESLLNMLIDGDIDVALEYRAIFEHFMEKRGVDESQFRKIDFRRQDMSVHFSKKYIDANPLFFQLFNHEIRRCVAQIQ